MPSKNRSPPTPRRPLLPLQRPLSPPFSTAALHAPNWDDVTTDVVIFLSPLFKGFLCAVLMQCTEALEKACPRLCYLESWLPLATGASSRNLGQASFRSSVLPGYVTHILYEFSFASSQIHYSAFHPLVHHVCFLCEGLHGQ